MDFELSDEHELLKNTVFKFMTKEVAPQVENMEREHRLLPDDLWNKMGELGILGITVPEQYGGTGFDLLAALLVAEQLSRVSSAVVLSYIAHTILCTDNIYRCGSEAQRTKYLPDLCSGKKIGGLALTEPNVGSDAVNIQTSAKKIGNEYILNGGKVFITNAPIADVLIVYAKTDKSLGAKGISAFIVEKGFPGFKVTRSLDKLGNNGSPTGELVFEDCRVPEENLLGKENHGIAVMMSGLDRERAVVSGAPLGIAEAAFEMAVQYSRDRKQFGQPIGSFQLIQSKLADMYTQIEATRLLAYKGAMAADCTERGGKGTEMHKLAAAAVLMAGEVATRVVGESLQIHGGYGYMAEYPISRLYRDVKMWEIGAGTSEIRRLVIAREILGL